MRHLRKRAKRRQFASLADKEAYLKGRRAFQNVRELEREGEAVFEKYADRAGTRLGEAFARRRSPKKFVVSEGVMG